jgi:DnaJ-class molecular chaperone
MEDISFKKNFNSTADATEFLLKKFIKRMTYIFIKKGGLQDCPSCMGTGKKISTCSACHGTRYRTITRTVMGVPTTKVEMVRVFVPGFGGKPGHYETRPKTVTVPGQMSTKVETVPCEICMGRGYKITQLKCPICQGTGKIL